MTTKEVKKRLFMIEYMVGFDKMTLKEKMALPIFKASEEIIEWFYETGTERNLPDKWEDFKAIFIELCTGTSFEQMRKYDNESWTGFLKRIQEIALHRNLDEKTVFEKLRREKAPRDILLMFYSKDLALTELIQMVENLESTQATFRKEKLQRFENERRSYFKKRAQKSGTGIKCYTCGKIGHTLDSCFKNNRKASTNVATVRSKYDSD